MAFYLCVDSNVIPFERNIIRMAQSIEPPDSVCSQKQFFTAKTAFLHGASFARLPGLGLDADPINPKKTTH